MLVLALLAGATRADCQRVAEPRTPQLRPDSTTEAAIYSAFATYLKRTFPSPVAFAPPYPDSARVTRSSARNLPAREDLLRSSGLTPTAVATLAGAGLATADMKALLSTCGGRWEYEVVREVESEKCTITGAGTAVTVSDIRRYVRDRASLRLTVFSNQPVEKPWKQWDTRTFRAAVLDVELWLSNGSWVVVTVRPAVDI